VPKTEETKETPRPTPVNRNDETKLKRVSDSAPASSAPEGSQLSKDDLLGVDIVIDKVTMAEGEFGEFAFVSFHYPNEKAPFYFSTGGVVVLRQLKELVGLGKLPALATLDKPARYYVLK